MAGTPKMQEHFSAGASQPTIPKNEARDIGCPPEMQEQFPAAPWMQQHFSAGFRHVQPATPRQPSRAKFMQMVYAAAQVNQA
jgi:hypothetical protein